MNIFEKFKRKWVQEKLDVQPGEIEETIIECFEKFGVPPTGDLLALYKALDGKSDMDKEYFRLWPLKEIQEENSTESEMTKKFGVLFGDYCVNSWCYRINKKGEVLIDYFTDDKAPILRSNSLADFFKLMEQNPDEALL